MTEGTVGTPTLLSLHEAARRCGMSKSNLSRKIKAGELSVREKGEDGAFRIDMPELARFMDSSRVQRATRPEGTAGTAPEPPGTALETQIELIEARKACEIAEVKVALTESALAEVRADRDEWRRQATLAQEQAAAVTRLLPGPTPERRRWWWRRRAD